MTRLLLPAALLLAGMTAAGQAQTAGPGQDSRTQRSNGIAAHTAPGVAAANDAAAGAVADRAAYRADLAAENQALYSRDVRAYEAARRARRSDIRRDRNYYDRQQRAYAQAMADWRLQVAACRRGHSRACNAPAPRPGDYM